MLKKYKDGQLSELKKINLKELSPRELSWLMESIDGDLKNFVKKNEKPRNNSRQNDLIRKSVQKRCYFSVNSINPGMIKQLTDVMEVGKDKMYSNQSASHVISTLQTIQKFKN